MMSQFSIKMMFFCGMLLAVASHLPFASAKPIGVCYGLNGDNLPPAADVINLYKACGIELVRLYEPRSDVLVALRGSGLGVAIGPRNELIQSCARNKRVAQLWVNMNIEPFKNDIAFRWITVGNEVIPGPIGPYVAPAMRNIHDALQEIGLGHVKVTTVLPGNALGASYPPSAGMFSTEITGVMLDVASVLARIGSPLLVNVYPYFAYASDPVHISTDYALFTSNKPVVIDGKYEYYNLFDAMIDAYNAALERIGYGNITISVAETGWPSAGNETFTSIENAKTYNLNLMNHVMSKGTPRKPSHRMETFMFEMFNEDMKTPGIEQNFGFFYPSMKPVYEFW